VRPCETEIHMILGRPSCWHSIPGSVALYNIFSTSRWCARMAICASRITDLSISHWVSKSSNALAFAWSSACPSCSSSSAFSTRNGCSCSARLEPGLVNWRWSVQDVVELEDKVFCTFRIFLGGNSTERQPNFLGQSHIYAN
jgi:hypothetical protein